MNSQVRVHHTWTLERSRMWEFFGLAHSHAYELKEMEQEGKYDQAFKSHNGYKFSIAIMNSFGTIIV